MAPVPERPNTPQDSPESYLGLAVEAAERQAQDRGWQTVRVLPPGAIITMEYVVGRLNLEVAEGAVRRCWKG